MAYIDSLVKRASLFNVISEYAYLEEINGELFLSPCNGTMLKMFNELKILKSKISAKEFCFLQELNDHEIWKEWYGNKPYMGIKQDEYLIALWDRYYRLIMEEEYNG